ncbi:U6 snRNA-associated Sm-like protein LSm4 [Babesia microti strain RI]|uniref:U6 snRNA-associated Sm-like protein LSm4 n=1 Tax=Babesia microti (strain RI) TaxID=1133968 RepID=I7IS63_BABMR|nr:U6 snRNA-associated Sm-like protein LSm4 [Babesia microti strain RI]CCF75361.2 U6 snRNA-associated Sm-like protein LSm4 [Babesia microti strain RI]|eukprot:XP_021337178.1 U6 snRNA-associated Sm-like protein LSm4 [Babesia microti strain RI]
MVLPLTLLRTAQGHPMLVELKNGETCSGILTTCDGFMNLHMRNVVRTSREGDKFWKINECFVRGNNLKSVRLPDQVANLAEEESRREQLGNLQSTNRGKAHPQRGRRGRGKMGMH